MFFSEPLKILAIGAHPDDVELGCGGFLVKCLDQGHKVYYVILSSCRKHQVTDHPPEARVNEAKEATLALGIKKENVTFLDFEDTMLPTHAYKIRIALDQIQAKILPNIVLCPSPRDTHQDHATTGIETLRTFRSGEFIFAYEVLRHGSYLFDPNLFVDITEHMETKIKALMCYKTQLGRSYFSPETFKALAATRGAQAGYGYNPRTYRYAEAFEILKMYL